MKIQSISAWGKEHGLSPANEKRMKLRRVTQAEATRLLGYPAPAGGVLIPYFDVNGNRTDFFRIRFDDYTPPFAELTGEKPMRYSQPAEPGVHIYFSPLVNWTPLMKDAKSELLITEGEFKAAKACQEGFPTIGIGGVAMWHLKGQRRLHPDLAQFTWQDRDVVIVFDSDAVTNILVRAQEFGLTAALVNPGARVKIVRLPEVGA